MTTQVRGLVVLVFLLSLGICIMIMGGAVSPEPANQKVRADLLEKALLECSACCDHINNEVTRANINQLKHQAARDSAAAILIKKNTK